MSGRLKQIEASAQTSGGGVLGASRHTTARCANIPTRTAILAQTTMQDIALEIDAKAVA